MVEEKNKLIKELIIDIFFALVLIVLTIIGVIYVFPEINGVNVVSTKDYECENVTNCKCTKNKCTCNYCLDDTCNETKKITCKK